MAAGSAQPRERAPTRPPRRATQARPRAEGAARGGSRRRARGAALEWRSGPPPPPSSAPRGPTLGGGSGRRRAGESWAGEQGRARPCCRVARGSPCRMPAGEGGREVLPGWDGGAAGREVKEPPQSRRGPAELERGLGLAGLERGRREEGAARRGMREEGAARAAVAAMGLGARAAAAGPAREPPPLALRACRRRWQRALAATPRPCRRRGRDGSRPGQEGMAGAARRQGEREETKGGRAGPLLAGEGGGAERAGAPPARGRRRRRRDGGGRTGRERGEQ